MMDIQNTEAFNPAISCNNQKVCQVLGRKARAIFREREKQQGAHLTKALLGRYQKSFIHPKRELRKLRRSAKGAMNAHNPHSRAFWFTVFAQELARHLEGDPSYTRVRCPLYFVTIIDRRQVIDPDLGPDDYQPSDFRRYRKGNGVPRVGQGRMIKLNPSWAEIRREYARCLYDFDCIGMVDAALYVSTRRIFRSNRLISAHVHALIWNTSEADLKRLCNRVRSRMQPLLDYATSIDVKQINPSDFLQMVWYVTKAPRKQYQLYRKTTGRVKQFKRGINGVNAVRLYDAMSDVTLNQLTFAQGRGRTVLSRMENRLERLRHASS